MCVFVAALDLEMAEWAFYRKINIPYTFSLQGAIEKLIFERKDVLGNPRRPFFKLGTILVLDNCYIGRHHGGP